NGAKVEILETKNGWHKIKYGSSYGYVSADYVKTTGSTSPSNPGTSTSKTGTVTASSLNVRENASTGSRVIGSLAKGSKVTVTETKNGWHKIKFGNKTGYVSADYIRF
ncbi:SH3 domain-containing protein, partial [uncultured Clostridium sp.]|uniref:SH3 domain-containing protein n=1 Tax=uncultured Clostridium sp. TaxID=59620 RepID=UPI0026386CEF